MASDQRGFSLIEATVALVLVALVLAVIVPRIAAVLTGPDSAATARELLMVIRQARGQAVANGQETVVFVDLDARTFGIRGGQTHRFDERLKVRFDTVATERLRDGAAGGIRFYPDGSSTGGRVTLAHDGRDVAVDVSWLTGRVTLHD